MNTTATPWLFVQRRDGDCEVQLREDGRVLGWLRWDEKDQAWMVVYRKHEPAGPLARTMREGARWLHEYEEESEQ